MRKVYSLWDDALLTKSMVNKEPVTVTVANEPPIAVSKWVNLAVAMVNWLDAHGTVEVPFVSRTRTNQCFLNATHHHLPSKNGKIREMKSWECIQIRGQSAYMDSHWRRSNYVRHLRELCERMGLDSLDVQITV